MTERSREAGGGRGGPLGSLDAARRALADGACPEDLLRLASRRNRALDEGERPVRAFLQTVAEEAGAAEERLETGEGPLAGVPVAIKDNLCTGRFRTTCGSRMLADYRSPYAATAVRRLEAAGARLFGTTNLDEFAMGSSTEHSAFGPTRNPVDRSRVPGGSSGGSAAAVAAGVVPVALGSDTGGSVRQPAAFCGVVGVKPTYGRVSRYGLVAFASSLDQVGVLARSVPDAAIALEAIAGRDPRDATSADRPPPRAAALAEHALAGAVLGVPREYTGERLGAGVGARLDAALEAASRAGAEIRPVSLPSTALAIPCYYVIAPAEASSNLARFDGVRYGHRAEAAGDDPIELMARTRGEGFGAEVKRRIMLGTYALSAGYYEAYYVRAQAIRRSIAREIAAAFEDGVDALFAPTTPTPAFRLGAPAADPYERYREDVFTVAANLAGIPAVSLPIGDAPGGLPVGGQLMGPAWSEERLLGLAAALERTLAYAHPLDAAGE